MPFIISGDDGSDCEFVKRLLNKERTDRMKFVDTCVGSLLIKQIAAVLMIMALLTGYAPLSEVYAEPEGTENDRAILHVCCIIEIPKVANQKWRMLHRHFGEKCKAAS